LANDDVLSLRACSEALLCLDAKGKMGACMASARLVLVLA
jgi:hypothetical protein